MPEDTAVSPLPLRAVMPEELRWEATRCIGELQPGESGWADWVALARDSQDGCVLDPKAPLYGKDGFLRKTGEGSDVILAPWLHIRRDAEGGYHVAVHGPPFPFYSRAEQEPWGPVVPVQSIALVYDGGPYRDR